MYVYKNAINLKGDDDDDMKWRQTSRRKWRRIDAEGVNLEQTHLCTTLREYANAQFWFNSKGKNWTTRTSAESCLLVFLLADRLHPLFSVPRSLSSFPLTLAVFLLPASFFPSQIHFFFHFSAGASSDIRISCKMTPYCCTAVVNCTLPRQAKNGRNWLKQRAY